MNLWFVPAPVYPCTDTDCGLPLLVCTTDTLYMCVHTFILKHDIIVPKMICTRINA